MEKYTTNDEQLEVYDARADLTSMISYNNEHFELQANELFDSANTEAEDDSEILSVYEELLGKKIAEDKEKSDSPEAQKRRELNAERALKRKEHKRRIVQGAFSQEDINLDSLLPASQCSLLIQALTQGMTDAIKKCSDYINRRCAFVLSKFIPSKLLYVAKLYPKSVKISPGFLYTVQFNDSYKERNTFWVKPNIPVYFEQGSERDIIDGYNPEIRKAIDRAVVTYSDLIAAREKLEIKYSTALVMRRITSYIDLLRYKPEWFEMLYNNVTGKKLVPDKND